jgi:lipopolysaccharide export system protein LptA
MRRRCACVLLIALAVASLILAAGSLAAAAAQRKPADITMDAYAVTADRLEGVPGGPTPVEWSGNVTVSATGSKVTCDRLKVWLAAGGRFIERAEASGHIVIQGRHVANDGTEWRVVGKAESAVYERKSGQTTLTGSVRFDATNLSTEATVSVEADRLIYDTTTRRFRFEGEQRQVRSKWQQPPSEAEPQADAAQADAAQADAPQAPDEQAESEP